MTPEIFTTQSVRQRDQQDAWREWFSPVFAITSRMPTPGIFPARNIIWKLDGLVASRVSAPAVRVQRTPTHVRRDPVDHWVLSYCRSGETTIRTPRGTLQAGPGVPFLWSLGEASETERTHTERLQLFLSRDAFRDIAPLLDAARGAVLDTPLGRLLGDFMLSLERRLHSLAVADISRLTAATRGLVAACIAPSAERLVMAQNQIDLGRLERVRQCVRTHLHSPDLGPNMLCRAVGMSRSNLYRLLDSEGGVKHYIQRQRLLEAYAALTDPNDKRSIATIAEILCFADPSSFGRAFRTTFGYSASEVRSAALAGLVLSRTHGKATARRQANFGEVLRGF